MNIHSTLTIFLISLTGFHIAAMQQQLINAAREGNVERVERLMLVGAPVTPDALFCPTANGNYDVVKTIFECGVDPEFPADPNQMFAGLTLFMHLVLDQNLQPQVKEKLIKLYLKHGADPEVRDLAGYSMLIGRVQNLDFNTLKLLLEQGACANAQDHTGFTVLMELGLASLSISPAESESDKMRWQELKKKAELLIQHGADVNLTDNRELTSLMKAVCQGNKTFVEFLLENGANVDLKDISGKSALDYAKYKPEILKLLKDAQKTTSKKSQDSQSDPTKKIINNGEI